VSDGCVTGVSDEGCEVILENCHTVAKRARIQRVENAEEAIEALGGKAVKKGKEEAAA
jgi:hypothetical protein